MKTANSSSAENIFWVEFLRYQNFVKIDKREAEN
jgi:hypothetical protein